MSLIYKLRIKGPYRPQTLPMARLAEYMADLASLLGESEHVHFLGIEEGSAVLAAEVDPAANHQVRKRLVSIRQGKGDGRVRNTLNSLDQHLATDNSTGSLTVCQDEKAEEVILEFEGSNRPQPIDYGVVHEESSLDGIPIKVGGKGKDPRVILKNQKTTWSGIVVTHEQAKQIAEHLYVKAIRLHGTGKWQRNKEGQWELKHFSTDSFEILDDTPLSEVVSQLRAITGSKWAEVEDPAAFLKELRE